MSIGKMTMFEFMAAVDGYAEANGRKRRTGDISEKRLAQLGVVGF